MSIYWLTNSLWLFVCLKVIWFQLNMWFYATIQNSKFWFHCCVIREDSIIYLWQFPSPIGLLSVLLLSILDFLFLLHAVYVCSPPCWIVMFSAIKTFFTYILTHKQHINILCIISFLHRHKNLLCVCVCVCVCATVNG